MSQVETSSNSNDGSEVALIVGGGPGISASCAKLFSKNGFRVAIAARNPDKPVLAQLEVDHGVRRYPCDATDPLAVTALFESVKQDLGVPSLVVHNIDGRVAEIFRKPLTEADPTLVLDTIRNSALSAFLVGQNSAKLMLGAPPNAQAKRGTIIFTNASAAKKGYPLSAAFAMACRAKAGLAESMARELMPQGIHVAHVPIDAAVGWTHEDGSRAHRLAGPSIDDNLADPAHIAEMYLQLHRQHRSTWAFEVVLRPWIEKW